MNYIEINEYSYYIKSYLQFYTKFIKMSMSVVQAVSVS